MPGSSANERQTLSRNELLALLRRVFEAIFGKGRDYEAMAEQIVWLECHGLGGIDLLRECVTRLDSEAQLSPAELEEVFASRGSRISLDAGSASLLCFGDMLADMLIARCNDEELCTLEVANLHDPLAILPQLHRMARAGRYPAVQVKDHGSGSRQFAHVSDENMLPALSGWEESAQSGGAASMIVLCAASDEALHSALRAFDCAWPEATIAPHQLAENYDNCLSNGIVVGDLNELNAIADRVLVEATDESRRGAGE